MTDYKAIEEELEGFVCTKKCNICERQINANYGYYFFDVFICRRCHEISGIKIHGGVIQITKKAGEEFMNFCKTLKIKKCKIHPKYKGIRKPTSKKEGCTCMEVYEQQKQFREEND